MMCGHGVWSWCVVMMCGHGVWSYFVVLVCGRGVWSWCVFVECANYDEYGINLLQTKRVKLMIESEDGEQEFDELETVEIPQEVIPSRFFLTAE